ncbi:hypothetical protein H5T88_04395 [bacterium]|nr:hypothetical protein [bacterium]
MDRSKFEISVCLLEPFRDASFSDRPVYIIHNAFDPEDFPSDVEIDNVFTLLFAGSIYGGTWMDVILSKLTEYPELKELFKLCPWTSHSVVVREELRATYLLLPLEFNESDWYFYSGKLFEYMGARRPILSIGSKYNLAGKLIEKLGIGTNCETAEEVEEFLLRALKNFYIEHKIEKIEWEKVKEFSWENQARKIGEILEKHAQ